ncbi:conserved exported hypothetical protein [Candidatus Sulfotelmatobacter kueseliae]|uniref:TonB-dependent transporter Oar-like beta-barrel domain-containing protein n=1 Tax=Candidatus Sulfotelmatobacter kueseliae TaxID=2042962 RepID=A0A2U3L8W6_9BACT|nr:conserved exported hypothetical protein [Candidatus Sulfotelmatobacter kueseliae]
MTYWGHSLLRSTFSFRVLVVIAVLSLACLPQLALGQQTLGSINGTVTDSSGAVVQGATVQARALATNLELTAQSKNDGSFSIADLPIGTYEVKFLKGGFQTDVHPQIILRADRTATINAILKPGSASEMVTVEATPLLNQVDTTTGYTLNESQITEMPLGTGSFTQLAILSPGVSADLLNTAGTNAGLGNQAVWSNGQRDTSNSFTINGVNANNLFNGKSSSQVTSSRVAVNIGENGNGNNPSGEIATSTSVYGAIGEALPSPPPETIQEMQVNSAMYDASQGANSGAQIVAITKSGTNQLHGGAYAFHQQTGWNANEWFFNHNQLPRPQMHRTVAGGYIGGPIRKDKLFFFGSYQAQRVTDQLLANSIAAVPPGLADNNRTADGLAALANTDFPCTGPNPACITASQITAQSLAIMKQKAPDGTWWIPNFQTTGLQSQGGDANILGPSSHFSADQVNANVDYYFSPKDRLALKYYFQNDPNATPFAQSTLLGFPQSLSAGSQTFSLDNATSVTPNLTWEQRVGFIRMRDYASTNQFIKPSSVGISIPGTSFFPGINLKNADNATYDPTYSPYWSGNTLSIGPVNNFANAGFYQNGAQFSTDLKWSRGHHSISSGMNFGYAQLNVINKNNSVARITFADFPDFLTGQVCGPNTAYCYGQDPSEVLSGATSRYYRSKQVGAYVQDNIRVQSNLTLDLGLRWDWDGPLYEKNGNLTNFHPDDYSYNVASDTIENIGLVIAGNNKAFGGTKGVSNSTLTGRQWGFAPRLGLAYTPAFAHNVVVRAGFGMYYDRGEYFSEFSPGAGGGVSGPFGVTVAEPFVVPVYAQQNSFAQPWLTVRPPPTNFSQVQQLLPNADWLLKQNTSYCKGIGESGCGPFMFAGYDPKNKLPYSENWTLDLQWQPKNDLVFTLGYVGNHGVHETIPLPFNQAQIATPQNPVLAGGPNQQNYSYGYSVTGVAAEANQTITDGYPTGNVSLRAPNIGYDPNSTFYKALGMSNYAALQFNVTKRLQHGLQVSGSYTYAHTLDEQSALGLFFNGNDPNNPRSAYGNSDFNRTHVWTVVYHYELPSRATAQGWEKQLINGWAFNGVTVLQSGQPYSVIDYTGGAASIYWGGGQDAVTNPIVPVGGVGATATNPYLQGTTGINGSKPVLNQLAFGIPAPITPGTGGVPPCDPVSGACDYFETPYTTGGRNIFHGPFQNRFDFGLSKSFKITESWALNYDVIAYNIFNHPSFDIPSNDVSFNPNYANPPIYTGSACVPATGAYQCPPTGYLGTLQHTIGSPRFIQMALHLTF